MALKRGKSFICTLAKTFIMSKIIKSFSIVKFYNSRLKKTTLFLTTIVEFHHDEASRYFIQNLHTQTITTSLKTKFWQ